MHTCPKNQVQSDVENWCSSLLLFPLLSFLSIPTSCTRSCSLLSGALYCFISSTGHGIFLPFVLQPLSTKSGPRVNWDRESHHDSFIPPASPSQIPLIASPVQILIPSSYLHILLGYTEGCQFPCLQTCRRGVSLCVRTGARTWCYRKKPTIYPHVCRKPSHNTREQNDVKTTSLLFQPFWRSQLSHVIGGEMAEAQPERKKPSELQWLNSLLP